MFGVKLVSLEDTLPPYACTVILLPRHRERSTASFNNVSQYNLRTYKCSALSLVDVIKSQKEDEIVSFLTKFYDGPTAC